MTNVVLPATMELTINVNYLMFGGNDMEDNKRMKKAAGILESLFKLIGGVLCAMVIVCIIFAVLVLIFGEKMFTYSVPVLTQPLITQVCLCTKTAHINGDIFLQLKSTI